MTTSEGPPNAVMDMLVLESPHDVELLRARPHRLWAVEQTVTVRLPTLTSSVQASWETKLNRSREVCGCFEGALCALVATIGSIIYWMRFDVPFGVQPLAVTVFAIIGAALVGKHVRRAAARLQVRRDLSALLAASDSANSSPGSAGGGRDEPAL